MKKEWFLLSKKKPTSPEGLKEILFSVRGIKAKKEFLSPLPPDQIKIEKTGIDKEAIKRAVALVKEAIKKRKRILVYGDYDVDGLCGTALVWETIYQLGGRVTPYIPDRLRDGYGLNQRTLARIVDKIPDLSLIISVDNGIVAEEAISFAQKKGIKTIVVDHHLPGKKLPPAEAIVHTTQLSGSGVAWFFVRELSLKSLGLPDLGLAALGTVADILPVLDVNRSLIRYGIPYLEKTRRVGLRHLFRQAGIEGKTIDTYKISFIIAPRINALGRIANPLDGLRLLCVRRLEKGEELARLAHRINQERQRLTDKGLESARKKIGKKIPSLIFVSSSSYHQGIIGLIAGKLAEEFNRPAIVVQKEGEISRGSARSINGVNIIEALRNFKELFLEVGGHAAAAGFKIKTGNLARLERGLRGWVKKRLKKKCLVPKLKIDCQLAPSQLTFDYWQAVSSLSPFGVGNWEPVFLVRGLRVMEVRSVGGNGSHLKLFLDDPGTPLPERMPAEAIGFGLGEWQKKLLPGDLVDLVFNLAIDHWGGREKVVLRIKDLRISQKVVK